MIVREIIIHHTASSRDNTTVEDVNLWHKARWANFKSSLGYWIGYHYLIPKSGIITQARRDNELGAHCVPNDGKIGICLCGNFETETPNADQLKSLQWLLEKLKREYNFDDSQIKAHNQLSMTLCPGKNLIDWLDKYRKVSFLQKQIEKIKKIIELLLKGRLK